jgi:hypothetical protein
MAEDDRTEHSRRYRGHSKIPTTMSHAPVATRTLSVVEKKTGAGGRWFAALILAGVAGAAVYSGLRFTPRNAAPSTPSTAVARPTAVAPTAATSAAPAMVSIEASASPGEATLYLDGKPLPSNPYVGRIAADDAQHLLRAEAPGYAGTTRAFLANREVAIILALARTSEPPPAEIRRVRPTVTAPPTAPVDPAKSAPDDCKVSPYYVDDRNIKVIRPECRRSIQSP